MLTFLPTFIFFFVRNTILWFFRYSKARTHLLLFRLPLCEDRDSLCFDERIIIDVEPSLLSLLEFSKLEKNEQNVAVHLVLMFYLSSEKRSLPPHKDTIDVVADFLRLFHNHVITVLGSRFDTAVSPGDITWAVTVPGSVGPEFIRIRYHHIFKN